MRLIDADALVEQMEAEAKYCEDSICKLVYEMDIREVKRAPTVDAVERKRGKWVLHPEVRNIYGGIYIECSECHTKYVVQYVEDEKYCRNCGAEMERGEANE